MSYAAARRHPVYVTWLNRLVESEIVTVINFTVEKERHRCEPYVRVGADVNSLTGGKRGWPHMVEENEGSDRP